LCVSTKARPVSSTRAARRSASRTVVVIGLSQMMWKPAFRNARAIGQWLSFGVTMVTASIPSDRRRSPCTMAW
jgi:hypothetical protein